MATKYLGNNSLLYLLTLIKTKLGEYATTSNVTNALAKKVDVVSGKGLSTNDYTTEEKNKLADIETGANKYTLPTAANGTLGGVTTTSTVISATGYTAVPIVDGVPYYKDTNTTYDVANPSANGLMSSADKTKLDGINTAFIPKVVTLNWQTKEVSEDIVSAVQNSNGGVLLVVNQLLPYENYIVMTCNSFDDEYKTISFKGFYMASGKEYYLELHYSNSTFSVYEEDQTIRAISVNNTTQTITANKVNITVPTYSRATTEKDGLLSSEDKAIIDKLDNTYAKKGETITYDGPYASLDALKTAHPTGTAGTIYLVSNSGTAPNIYNEYVWVTPTTGTAAYELIGTTAVDLSDYLKKADLVEFENADIQTAWDNA